MSTLKMSTFFPLQTVNETLRGGCRAHWWLHFPFLSHLSLTWLFVCRSLSLSVSVLLFLSQSFFLCIPLVPCHFSVLCFVSFYPCTALSCTDERMTDVGVGWEMEPVIYFPVFCRACIGARLTSTRDNFAMKACLDGTMQCNAAIHMHGQHIYILLPSCCCHWQTDVCWCPWKWESKQCWIPVATVYLTPSLSLWQQYLTVSLSWRVFTSLLVCLIYSLVSLCICLCFPTLPFPQILCSIRGYFCQHPCSESSFFSLVVWGMAHMCELSYPLWVKLFTLCPFICVWACTLLVYE